MTYGFGEFDQIADALARTRALIASHPGANSLFAELGEFYMHPVEFRGVVGQRSSYFCPLNPDASGRCVEWPPRRVANIDVVRSNRALEAACHEMLHLLLPKLGYAKCCSDPILALGDEQRLSVIHAVNQIEHQVMLPMFLELGFATETFLCGGQRVQLDGEFERFGNPELISNPEAWSAALVEFFGHWQCGHQLRWAEFHSGQWHLRGG